MTSTSEVTCYMTSDTVILFLLLNTDWKKTHLFSQCCNCSQIPVLSLCVCVSVCMWVRVCVHVSACLCACECVSVCMWVRVCVHVSAYVYTQAFVLMLFFFFLILIDLLLYNAYSVWYSRYFWIYIYILLSMYGTLDQRQGAHQCRFFVSLLLFFGVLFLAFF